jgi:hypothetical protein
MENIDNAVDLGLAWQLSGETRYLELSRQIVLGYADRYLSYEWIDHQGKKEAGGRVFCTHLNEANWLISMAWAYDLIASEITSARIVCCLQQGLSSRRSDGSITSRAGETAQSDWPPYAEETRHSTTRQ